MDGFEGIGDFDSADPWERYMAHQAAKGTAPLEQIEAKIEQDRVDDAEEEA